jgi:hypothetical protein
MPIKDLLKSTNYEAPFYERCLMDNFLLIYSLERNQDDRMKEAEKGGI